jgi:hypothetical protein
MSQASRREHPSWLACCSLPWQPQRPPSARGCWLKTTYDAGPGDRVFWSIVAATESKAQCDEANAATRNKVGRGTDSRGATFTDQTTCLPDTRPGRAEENTLR